MFFCFLLLCTNYTDSLVSGYQKQSLVTNSNLSELNKKIPRSFFLGEDVVSIARQLIGKVLVTQWNGVLTKGKIVETEAYCGWNDKACHANNGLRTQRTEVMYRQGGTAYVYLCYGIHHLFNVVTNVSDKADAVLIRGLEPVEGEEIMRQRVGKGKRISQGPGLLSRAMNITIRHTGIDLLGDDIWLEYPAEQYASEIVISKRIGVDYAEEDADLPWRFYEKDNAWISRK